MTIPGPCIVEVCVYVPTTFVRLLHLIEPALDGLRAPSVEVRHSIVPSTIRVARNCGTSWERSGARRVEERRGRVAAGSGVRRWGISNVVSVEGVHGGPTTTVK
jgi:hypothetical protein